MQEYGTPTYDAEDIEALRTYLVKRFESSHALEPLVHGQGPSSPRAYAE
jgi:hypothetical protein